MSFAGTAALGLAAGVTIYLGLPIGRLSRNRPARMAFLNAAAVGVLLFLFYDVIKNASETIEAALGESRARGIGYGVLLAAGLAVGMLGLVVFERVRRRRPVQGPGAMAMAQAPAARASREPLDPA